MGVREQPAGSNPFQPSYWVGQIDLRPIALFRIGLGLFLFYDLCDLLTNLSAWFSDEGVLPRAAFLGNWARADRFSLLDAFGSVPLVYIYWALAALAVLAMAAGYRTRIASVASFILIAGFQERLPPLFDGSDTVIRLMLFWHLFTDSGRVWSVDTLLARKRGAPLPETGSALPVRMVQTQIGWIYFCSIFNKLQGATWRDGTALHYCLHLTHVFSRLWAVHIADLAPLMMLGTYFTLIFEGSFIFLVNSPIWHRKLKAAALLMGTALHLGIAATINVGLFSYLMPTTYLCLFEPEWAQWVVDRALGLGPARVEGLRSLALRLPASTATSLFQPREPARERLFWGFSAALTAWFVLVSGYSLPKPASGYLPRPVELAIQTTDLWSSWDMFSPEPLRTDYHLSAPAEYEDGSTADLFGGPSGGPGERRGFWFTRWWKYFENVTGGDKTLPLEWGRFMCRERNFHLGPSEPRLYTFTLYKDNQIIPPIGQPWPPVQRQTVWVHRCYDKPAPPKPAVPGMRMAGPH